MNILNPKASQIVARYPHITGPSSQTSWTDLDNQWTDNKNFNERLSFEILGGIPSDETPESMGITPSHGSHETSPSNALYSAIMGSNTTGPHRSSEPVVMKPTWIAGRPNMTTELISGNDPHQDFRNIDSSRVRDIQSMGAYLRS